MSYPVFATGDVLNASDMNAVSGWLVKSQAVGSGVSSVTVTGAFSADYDNYRIIYAGGVASTSSELQLRLGSATSGYNTSVIYTAWSNTPTPLAVGTLNGSIFTFGGAGDADGALLTLDVMNPFLARRTTISGAFIGMDTDRGTGHITGLLTNTTSFTEFTIIVSTGTITGGTIRVYGYRN